MSGFVALPTEIVRAEGLSTKAKLVYAGILSYSWGGNGCRRTQVGLAAELGLARRTVQRALIELREAELIRWTTIATKDGRANVYRPTGVNPSELMGVANVAPPMYPPWEGCVTMAGRVAPQWRRK